MINDFIARFNENDLLNLLVAVELYMKEHKNCANVVKESHSKFNQIWYKLKTKEDYMIYGEPF